MAAVLYWLYRLCLTLLVVNTLLYTWRLRTNRSGWLKIIVVFLWTMLLIQIASEAVARLYQYNLYFSHIYIYSQSVLLGAFYYRICRNVKQRKFIKWYLICMTLVLMLQYIIDPSLFFRYNILEVILGNYILIIASFFYLYNTASEKRHFTYLSLGILLWVVLDISVLMFGNVLAVIQIQESGIIWLMRQVSAFLFYSMILIQWFKLFGYHFVSFNFKKVDIDTK